MRPVRGSVLAVLRDREYATGVFAREKVNLGSHKKSSPKFEFWTEKLAFSAVRRFPTFLPSSPTKVGFEAFLGKTAKLKSFPETHLKTFFGLLTSRGTLKSIFAHRADLVYFSPKVILADF